MNVDEASRPVRSPEYPTALSVRLAPYQFLYLLTSSRDDNAGYAGKPGILTCCCLEGRERYRLISARKPFTRHLVRIVHENVGHSRSRDGETCYDQPVASVATRRREVVRIDKGDHWVALLNRRGQVVDIQ